MGVTRAIPVRLLRVTFAAAAIILSSCGVSGAAAILSPSPALMARARAVADAMDLPALASQVLMVGIGATRYGAEGTARLPAGVAGQLSRLKPGAILLFRYNIPQEDARLLSGLSAELRAAASAPLVKPGFGPAAAKSAAAPGLAAPAAAVVPGLAAPAAASGTAAAPGYAAPASRVRHGFKPPVMPPLLAVDHEGGVVFRFGQGVTRLPSAAEMGRQGAASIEALGRQAGAELRSLGIGMALAPVVEALTPENRDFLGSRSFGADPSVVDAAAGAFIRGLQGSGLAAAAKHFPGNTATDPHKALPVLQQTKSQYEKELLPRFAAAGRAGVAAVMVSHAVVPAIDPVRSATLSPAVIRGQLKGRLGFKGVVLTDDLYMAALAEDPGDAAVGALKAGADLLMVSALPGALRARDAIVAACRSGRLAEGRLRNAASRVVALKMRFGVPGL